MSAPLSGLDVIVALLASVAAAAIYLAQPDAWSYRWLCGGIVPLAVVARRLWFPVGGDDAVEPRPTAPSKLRTVGGIALMITGGVVALLMGLLVAAMVTDPKGEGVAWAAVPAAIGAAGLAVATVGFRLGRR